VAHRRPAKISATRRTFHFTHVSVHPISAFVQA
jgi:hypothetical protein